MIFHAIAIVLVLLFLLDLYTQAYVTHRTLHDTYVVVDGKQY